VNMTPRTATNHRLGPGWGPYFWFEAGNGQTVRPVDNLNGTYTASIPFNGATPPSVSVHYIDDPVKIPEDTTSASGLPVPLVPANVLIPSVPSGGGGTSNPFLPGAWRFFLDAGVNFPQGDLSDGADGKFSINTGFERLFGNNSIEGILGYHRFDIAFVSNPHIWQLSVNGKHYFGSTPLHPFVNAGVGAYRFDPGNETKFGWNAGGGVLYDLSSKWGIEAVYNYHDVNADGGHVQFSTLQGGVRISF
jgi:opacity protein-like surface antigen